MESRINCPDKDWKRAIEAKYGKKIAGSIVFSSSEARDHKYGNIDCFWVMVSFGEDCWQPMKVWLQENEPAVVTPLQHGSFVIASPERYPGVSGAVAILMFRLERYSNAVEAYVNCIREKPENTRIFLDGIMEIGWNKLQR